MSEGNGARECGCPAWARCAHYGDEILWMSDYFGPDYPSAHRPYGKRFRVSVGQIELSSCWFSKCPEVHPTLYSSEPVAGFDDLPAAEAEFRRREAAMLGREEE